MATIAIIQARMGSTRLPGKVLQDIEGATMLERVVGRAQAARMLDEVVVATTTGPEDEAIVAECGRLSTRVTRGSRDDVLDRYHRTALDLGAQVVVRLTADCPLIDPAEVDHVVRDFGEARADYASNSLVPSYPRGLDTEAMTFEALEIAHREATLAYQRVHVTPFLYQHPERFRLHAVVAEADFSHHRWTVDTPADLAFVRAVYAAMGARPLFGWREVLDLVARRPELPALNRHVVQKGLEEG
jgi:spore coat polysaccharide biosynthesis protein SpsF